MANCYVSPAGPAGRGLLLLLLVAVVVLVLVLVLLLVQDACARPFVDTTGDLQMQEHAQTVSSNEHYNWLPLPVLPPAAAAGCLSRAPV
jgi:hypothetical protein